MEIFLRVRALEGGGGNRAQKKSKRYVIIKPGERGQSKFKITD